MDNLSNEFLFVGYFQNDQGEYLAYGHLKGSHGFAYKVSIISSDQKTCSTLEPGEIYEVKVIGFNGSTARFGF